MSKHPRAPFVVTVAAVAGLVVACGSDGEPEPQTCNPCGPSADGATDADGATLDLGLDSAPDDASVNPAECPATDPGIGANHKPCTAAASVRCAYQDLCPQHPVDQTQNVYACHDDGTGDHWTLASKDYVPSCPPSEPKSGDPCPCTVHMGFVACNYGLCEDLSRTYAACKGVDSFDLEWKVTPITCNPPEVDGGDGGDALDGD